jgi:hypothetical protein
MRTAVLVPITVMDTMVVDQISINSETMVVLTMMHGFKMVQT